MTDLTKVVSTGGGHLVNPDEWTGADLLRGLPARLHMVLEATATANPGHPAFIESGVTWSYADFAASVVAVAADLVIMGIRPGDRIMIVSENSVAASAFVLAASRLDAWAIVTNPRLSDRELDQIYVHSGARRRFFMRGISTEATSHADRCLAASQAIGPYRDIGVGPLNDAANDEPVHPDGDKQVAVLIYTSGTTGMPKGVMLSHHNLMFAARSSGLLRALVPDDRVYGVLPMSHIIGLSIGLVSTMMFGATNVVVAKYDPAHLARSIANDGISILSGVPATYQRLLAHKITAGIARLPSGRLRLMSVAGAPLDLALKGRVEAEFGMPLTNAFGITECSPSISSVRNDDPRADDSVGKILPGIDTRIVRAGARLVADGGVGELHVRGPNARSQGRSGQSSEPPIDNPNERWICPCTLVRGGPSHAAGSTDASGRSVRHRRSRAAKAHCAPMSNSSARNRKPAISRIVSQACAGRSRRATAASRRVSSRR